MIKPLALLSFVLCAQPLFAEAALQHVKPQIEAANWHLLTQSHGGTVSLLKNLTQSECEFARARALGLPATDEEKKQQKERDAERAKYCKAQPDLILCDNYSLTMVNPGTITMAECFQ